MEEELAVGRELVADEQVQVLEPGREEEASKGRVDGDPGRARPARLGAGRSGRVTLAGGKVELVQAGAGDDIAAGSLAEVDARFGDVRGAGGRDRRQVADEQPRLALVGDFVHGRHDRPDAVREDDPLVREPDRVRVLLEREFTRGDPDLALGSSIG